jgi:hypothetical protein
MAFFFLPFLLATLLALKIGYEYRVMMRVNEVARQFGSLEYNTLTYWRDFFRGTWDMAGLLKERYFDNPDSAFVIPCMYYGPVILIPPRLDPEFRSLTDSTLSARNVQFKIIQPWHMFPDPTWNLNPAKPYRAGFNRALDRAADVDRSSMAAKLARRWNKLVTETGVEVIDEKRGNWTTIKLNDTLMSMMGTEVTEMCVGSELAEDKAYVTLLLSVMQSAVTWVWVINLFPEFAKP